VKRTRLVAMVAGALVAGIVLGSVASGYAAVTSGSPANSAAAACTGLGLRLGATMRDSGGRLLDVVAKLTGKTTAAVVAERQAGKTFAQIAADKGVSQTAVVDATLKVRQDTLATKVKAGAITQTQADTALSRMKTRLADRVTSTNSACDGSGAGSGGQGRGAGRGGNGCGGGGCGNSSK
jgi:hypothetical protein